jgi:arylsulfatase A-like enzyme
LPGRVIYSAGPGFRARSLHHGDWKLIVRDAGKGGGGVHELFHLGADPSETRDLSTAEAGKLAEMKARLDAATKADRDAVAAKRAQ